MAQFPSTTSADGIWSLKQQRRAKLGDDWPINDILYVGSATYAAYTNDVVYASGEISGLETDDLLVVFISNDLSDDRPTPSGWSLAYAERGFSGTSYTACFYKVASSSTDTAVTFTTSVTGGSPSSTMLAFRNASFSSASVATVTADPPSQSCSDGDCAIINLHYQDADSIASITPPSGYTTADHAYVYVSSALSSGNWSGYKLGLSAPSEDPATIGGAPTGTETLAAATVILTKS